MCHTLFSASIDSCSRHLSLPTVCFQRYCAHFLSKGKITFQSFFMLMTAQPLFFASAMSASVNVPIFDSAP
jgi:hypothetical protein